MKSSAGQEIQFRISVRNFVEFIIRSGDIDNRRRVGMENAMTEGGRIHRMIQRRMGSEYEAEVPLRYVWESEKYQLIIEGRADGIITLPDQVTIDEIKGTYRDLEKVKQAQPVHLAQAKCYAYIYAEKKQLDSICVRMTYCNMDTEELKYFFQEYTFQELEEWFLSLVKEYQKWTDYQIEWENIRQQSIRELQFPFPYRKGQKELAASVYRTIFHKKKLFLEAPTGVGKTLSTVFPAVKALGESLGERIFYLTAKTITRTAAMQAFGILRKKGLRFKTVVITAKEKICFMEETNCNPDYCPYAKGHFDRINEAIFDIITQEEEWNRTIIEKYASKHRVCPFEFGLDCSLFADGIIGDYNYLFDPHVYLKRFFSEGASGKGIFLIDEAHNLVDRGREMYSAILLKEDFLALKKQVKTYSPKMEKQLEKCNRELLLLKKETTGVRKWDSIESFVLACNRLSTTMSEYLENHDDSPVREEVLDFFFEISHFLMIYDGLNDGYVIYTKMMDNGDFLLKLFCVDPSSKLKECMDKGVSSILFSATLIPVQYYKKLLGGKEEDFEVYAESNFDTGKRALLIANDVTSKYTRRTEEEFYRIASYISRIIEQRQGNYIAFFPSYAMMEQVYERFEQFFNHQQEVECLLQKDFMKEEEREVFLKHFTGNVHLNINENIGLPIEIEEKSLLGFCVLGGIFSEGIDLKQDSLIGAIIIGTGLPLVCPERELLKSYFDEVDGKGFDYAYRYPGMNKVLQAAGRVIRTHEDCGIVALLDERFLDNTYRRLFPREWREYTIVQENTVGKCIEKFWNEWL